MSDKQQKDSWANLSWGNNQGWNQNNQQGWANNQGQNNNQQQQNWGNQGNQGNQNWGNNQGNQGAFNNIGVSGFQHFTNGSFGQYGASYAIKSAYGKVLDINRTPSNKTNMGDAIIYDFYGGKNQRFTIANNGQDLIIRSVQDDRIVEALSPDQFTKGTVRAGPFNGTPNERWRIRKVDNGTNNNLYFIVNVGDGKCLDVQGQKSSNNTNVITWPFNGKKNQMWEIVPVAPGQKNLPKNYNSFGGGNW